MASREEDVDRVLPSSSKFVPLYLSREIVPIMQARVRLRTHAHEPRLQPGASRLQVLYTYIPISDLLIMMEDFKTKGDFFDAHQSPFMH